MIIDQFVHILKHSIMITGFVFVMMLIVEYINVQTHGLWQKKLSAHRWQQYLFSALLGVIPGCLGAFAVVTMYSHGLLSFGAIVAAMIATSGDEAFMMLAAIPKTALIISVVLFIIAIISAFLVDKIVDSKKLKHDIAKNKLPLHSEDNCQCFEKNNILQSIKNPSVYRIILFIVLLFLSAAVIFGVIADEAETWIRFSLVFVTGISLFIVITVPEHFLKEHLWEHVTKIHTPKIFYWVFGTLLVINILLKYFNIESLISDNIFLVLLIAILIGIIPESGPHFIFITLFAQGIVPFSVLLASSISQDGHGMLPLLAESRKNFIAIKMVNVIIAFVVGIVAYLIGL